jgi:dTDP-glucose 4,6-dehydratase
VENTCILFLELVTRMNSSIDRSLPQLRVVVTGGAGFIGSALCRHMVGRRGDMVLNVDNLTYAANSHSLEPIVGAANYRFAKMDIANATQMEELIQEFGPDAVVHLAAETHVDRSIDSARPFIQTNVVGTSILLDVAKKYWMGLPSMRQQRFRFVVVSTDEVYGSLGLQDPPFTEASPYDPSSPYAASKAAADHLASSWYRTYGLPIIISNCSNNFGPCQFPEKLIPLTILNALEGKMIGVYGQGQNIRDWLYVDDHVRALVQILQEGKPGEKYNIGARNERTNLQVARAICDIVDDVIGDQGGRQSLIEFVTDRPGHDLRYAIDPSKAERELGWSALESFEAALRQTVRWYIQNRGWWEPIRQKVYAGERLGQGIDMNGGDPSATSKSGAPPCLRFTGELWQR